MKPSTDEPMQKATLSPAIVFVLAVVTVSLLLCGGIGALLLPPAIQQAREAKRRQQAVENLRQIEIALHNYHQSYRPASPKPAGLTEQHVRRLADRFKTDWLEQHPEQPYRGASISEVQKTADGWLVVFENIPPPAEPESEERDQLRIEIDAEGNMIGAFTSSAAAGSPNHGISSP